jgi:streptogramin lyase
MYPQEQPQEKTTMRMSSARYVRAKGRRRQDRGSTGSPAVRHRAQPRVEGLEGRALLASITEYPITVGTQSLGNGLVGITGGPDGNVYFTDTLNDAIGQITPSGVITELPLPAYSGGSFFKNGLDGITLGSDNRLVFTESTQGALGKITTNGTYTQYPIGSSGSLTGQGPDQITTASDGTLWWTEDGSNAIGDLTPAGVFNQFAVPGASSGGIIGPSLKGITVGSDGNVWFTNWGALGDFIGRMTPTGDVTEFPLPFGTDPVGIVNGPDGNLWFMAYGSNTIDVMATSGTMLHQYPVPVSSGAGGLALLTDITVGPDKNLYFTEQTGDIGEITTSGVVTITPVSTTITTVPGASGPQPLAITSGPDGNIWFTDPWTDSIGVLKIATSAISDYLIVATVTPPGQKPSYNGPALLFGANGDALPTPLPAIPPGPQTSLYDPDGAIFNPATGELFISNREGGTGGSISRFFVDAAGNYTSDGTITGNGLAVVSQLAFHDGELFAANYWTGTISRFKFDAQSAPIPDGSITVAPYLEGIAFSPSGELFASTYSKIYRYLIDSTTGAATPSGTIPDPGPGRLHYMAFSSDGDLFVASFDDSRILRFSFDNSGKAVLDQSISVDHPLGVAISRTGELLVTTHGNRIGKITSFLPGPDGNYAANWSIPSDVNSDSLGGIAIEPMRATTSTAAASTSTPFSTASQTVSLGATVMSSAGTVNEGTETFTIVSGNTVIGSAVTVNVVNGAAGARYVVPGGTPKGTYTIRAVYNGTIDFGGSSDSTHTLTVTQPAPAKLVIHTEPPSAATAGQPFATATRPVVVYEEDAYGNLETSDSTTVVRVALGSGVGPLSGTFTAAVSGGIATFNDLVDDTAETITLTFSGGDLTTATSEPITVSPAPASRLFIARQPSPTAKAGQPFTTQPVIYEEDQFGNLETGDNTAVVTVSLASGTGPL